MSSVLELEESHAYSFFSQVCARFFSRASLKLLKGKTHADIIPSNIRFSIESLSQRFAILSKKIVNYRLLMKQREYNRHLIKIIIDMDALTCGFHTIRFGPKPPVSLSGKPYHFQFHIQRKS